MSGAQLFPQHKSDGVNGNLSEADQMYNFGLEKTLKKNIKTLIER